MNGVYLALGALLLLAQQSECQSQENVDSYMDKLMNKVRSLVYDKGLDPYDAIDKTIVGIHVTGELAGMRSLHRASQVNVTESDQGVQADALLRVFNLKAKLGWKSTFSFLPTLEGSATATIKETVIKVHFEGDKNATRLTITGFHIDHIGHIHTDVELASKIPGFDKFVFHVSDAIANALKNVVIFVLRGPIRQVMDLVLDEMGVPQLPQSI